jgi:glycogen synthase
MTRLLMSADTVGGVWTYALELADALRPSGVEVHLATMGRPLTREQWRQVDASAVVTVHESDFALEWMDDPWDDVDRAGAWLLGLEAALRTDIVHLNGYVHAALPWDAPAVVVGHSCVVSWWQAVLGSAPPPAWDEYRRRVSAGLAAASAVVAPTAAMLAALQRAYGIDGGVVIANGRDPRCCPVGTKEPLVLAAGRLWDDAKNVAAVDRVAGRIPVPVVIAGPTDPPAGGAPWESTQSKLLGPLSAPDLAAWMGRAAVFVLPARYEPFGLAVLEAALAGCALVLGDIPSLREIWGEAALYVSPEDDDELAGTLQHLVEDVGLCSSLGGRARQRALTYRPERMAAGYVELYATVAAIGSQP